MNRRNFLQLAALAIAGKAAERVFPFRVYSIPKKIEIAKDISDLPPTGVTTLLEYQNAVFREVSMRALRLNIGDAVEIYSGLGDYLRGSAKVQRIEGGNIILDHLPAGCVVGDTITRRTLPGISFHQSSGTDFLGLRRS